MTSPSPSFADKDVFGTIVGRRPDEFDEASESQVFKTVLYHCMLVLSGPIVAFFATKALLLGPLVQWDPHEAKTDVVSAVVAVIILHLAVGWYIIKAYNSDRDVKKQMGKRD